MVETSKLRRRQEGRQEDLPHGAEGLFVAPTILNWNRVYSWLNDVDALAKALPHLSSMPIRAVSTGIRRPIRTPQVD
jgi:hypothetical protein